MAGLGAEIAQAKTEMGDAQREGGGRDQRGAENVFWEAAGILAFPPTALRGSGSLADATRFYI